jgi:hypothetical protein
VGNHRSSENVDAATLIDIHNYLTLPQSSSASCFTAGASGFFHLAPIARAAAARGGCVGFA